MARELLVVMAVVVPDEPPENRGKLLDLRGRELAGVPGSWVTRVAVHDLRDPLPAHAARMLDAHDSPDTTPGTDGSSDTDLRHTDTSDTDTSDTDTSDTAACDGGGPDDGLTQDERDHELALDLGLADPDS